MRKHPRYFSAYVEGELSRRDRERLELHLRECARCVEELRLLRRTVEALDALPIETTAPDFLERLDRRIQLERGAAQQTAAPLRRAATTPWWRSIEWHASFAIAAVCVALLLIVPWTRSTAPTAPTGDESSALRWALAGSADPVVLRQQAQALASRVRFASVLDETEESLTFSVAPDAVLEFRDELAGLGDIQEIGGDVGDGSNPQPPTQPSEPATRILVSFGGT